jgi:hypothetical protein
MSIERDRDEEIRATADRRLLDTRRRVRAPHDPDASAGRVDAAERRQHPDRRQQRSDTELRQQREELERQWNAAHPGGESRKSA